MLCVWGGGGGMGMSHEKQRPRVHISFIENLIGVSWCTLTFHKINVVELKFSGDDSDQSKWVNIIGYKILYCVRGMIKVGR